MGERRRRDDDDDDDDDGPGVPPTKVDTTPILVGDVVQAKAGGPFLTVTQVDTVNVTGVGFDYDGRQISITWPLVVFRKRRN